MQTSQAAANTDPIIRSDEDADDMAISPAKLSFGKSDTQTKGKALLSASRLGQQTKRKKEQVIDPGKSQFQQLYGLMKADGEKDRQLSREMSDQQGNLLRELLGPLIQHVLARNGALSNAAEVRRVG